MREKTGLLQANNSFSEDQKVSINYSRSTFLLFRVRPHAIAPLP